MKSVDVDLTYWGKVLLEVNAVEELIVKYFFFLKRNFFEEVFLLSSLLTFCFNYWIVMLFYASNGVMSEMYITWISFQSSPLFMNCHQLIAKFNFKGHPDMVSTLCFWNCNYTFYEQLHFFSPCFVLPVWLKVFTLVPSISRSSKSETLFWYSAGVLNIQGEVKMRDKDKCICLMIFDWSGEHNGP